MEPYKDEVLKWLLQVTPQQNLYSCFTHGNYALITALKNGVRFP
jgi:hypothetical protein